MKLFKHFFFAALLICPGIALGLDQIKVGVCLALTGEGAKWGAAHLAGIQLAEQDLKASGISLKLVVEDTGTSSHGSVSCFKKVKEVQQVNGVIGNIFGFLTTPMQPLAKQAKIPLVSTSTTRMSCPKDNLYFFAASEQFADIPETFHEFLLARKEIKTIAVIALDDPEWGMVNKAAIENVATKLSVKVVESFTTQEMKFDFRTIYPRILSKSPDAIFVFHEPSSTVLPLRELGYKGVIVESNAVGELLWDSPKAPDFLEGVYFTDIPQAEDFSQRFLKKFGKKPFLEAHSGYDALNVLVKSIVANPEDPAVALRQGVFRGVNGGDIDFRTGCAGKKSVWKMFRIEQGVPHQVE